jgi:hypothetical protein
MPQSGQAAGIRLSSSTVHAACPGETEKTLRLGAGAQDAGDFMPPDERGRSLAQARHRPTCTERQSEPVYNYIDIELVVPLGSDQAISASEVWANAMKSEGDTWIEDAKFNCSPAGDKYQQIADNAFSNVSPTWLFVGYGQDEWMDQAVNGCSSQ